MNIYSDTFNKRGFSYHSAMGDNPLSRKTEFDKIFLHYPLRTGESILDVPSGGGYLRSFVPDGVKVDSLEFSRGFSEDSLVVPVEGPWTSNVYDRVVSLAALHHIPDLHTFGKLTAKSLKQGGTFHFADVGIGSPVARFLEEFVHDNTEGGHRGIYRDWGNLHEALPDQLRVISVEERTCPWEFKSVANMVRFCKGLFCLRPVEDSIVEQALGDYIGWYRGRNTVFLNWRLTYVDGIRTVS